MATIQNLTIDQDADFTQTLTVKDSTGTVVDISGQTVTSKLRKTHLSSTSTSFTTAIVSGTDGTYHASDTTSYAREIDMLAHWTANPNDEVDAGRVSLTAD